MASNALSVSGTVSRRRSMGRRLAFIDLVGVSIVGKSCGEEEIISAAFRAEHFLEPIPDGCNAFPSKKSSIPYGARIKCSLQPVFLENSDAQNSGPPFQVLSWTILEHPKDAAMEFAAEQGGGTSCTKYLQSRGAAYLTHNKTHHGVKIAKNPSPGVGLGHVETNAKLQSKTLRSKIFADFLIEKVFRNNGSDRVLDVAGGKGHLSLQIAQRCRIPCTVIDPLIRKAPKFKHLLKTKSPIPQFLAHMFQKNQQESIDAVSQSTCLVGLHPDEPTEDIVDLALEHNRSFAVVPCCVFPTFFPMRRLRSGGSVHTHEEFLQYLLEKDSRMRMEQLPFEGKNHVIYWKA